ncbi:DEAD/DEAH box helicase [Novacetimonas hansenii]|uniref:DEAD-box ATP-dependent RNA helicase RhpA n=1 Tax=Novacetimonas hansenii TaxID=436 RepID=A0AAW5EP93_NOVHA|nr:DEAD/DEAH box helicase [Novacetimonas hansenii]MCJ8353559.1 DEAD/DEAH box helicase [Novacetimonas hansenii]
MSAKKNTTSAPAGSAKVGRRVAATAGDIMPISDIEIVTPPETEDAPQPLFSELGLSAPLQQAIEEMGYRHPTPIQAQAIPYILMGRDVLGVAQTGTGKTASFTLPMLEILSGSRARARMPRSLILEPTRELALQVAENFVNYGKHLKLTHALLIGGESMAEQKEALNRGVDVLIATPGRLIDLFERGGLLLTQTKLLVIDEADRMLDMGFIPDIEKIVSMLSPIRQTLFFSATMAPEIRRLADMFLHNPKEITVSRPSSVASTIETGLVIVEEDDKRRALRKLLRESDMQNAIIFCNRKRDVDVLCKSLLKHGFSAGALHGDLPQSLRFSTLEAFKSGELKILVCSDIAARGIDIGGLSHVFNFDLPFHAEDYVHRIGRTGRAGRTGHAYSLATPYEQPLAEAIEKLTGKPIVRLEVKGIDQTEWSDEPRPRGRKRGGKPAEVRTTPQAPAPTGKTSAPSRKPAVESRNAVAPTAVSATAAPPARPASPPRHAATAHAREEHGNERPQAGFGGDIPAFMLLPRRTAPVIPTPEDEIRPD